MEYEFFCPTHGTFAKKQQINELHVATCPQCGTTAIRKFEPAGHYYDKPKPLFHKDGRYRVI